MSSRARRVLVTGGTGFVGANLARRLVYAGNEVHLLARAESPDWRLKGWTREVQFHRADLRDANGVIRTVRDSCPEWVFHLAVYGDYESHTDAHRMIETNIAGTQTLLQECVRVGCEAFIHAGSSSEYGFKDHAPSELERPDPASHYAVTKAAATMLCTHAARSAGLRVTTLRLYTAYGPWDAPGRLIPTLAIHGLRGCWPPLANPAIARDFVYVDDVVDAFLLAVETPSSERGAVYNVGTGVQTSLCELVNQVRRVLQIDAEPAWGTMNPRHWDTECWIADPSKIRSCLGWRPRYDLKSGIESTLQWFREADLTPYGVR